MAIDQAKLDEFLGHFVADLGAAFHAPAVVVGDKLGLYKALAAAGPSTPAELAARTSTSERYVTEWLRGQAASGYVTYDPAGDRYRLTEEQAFALADDTSPAFVPGAFQVATSTAKDEPRIAEAFRTGGGLGWDEHHPDLWQGTERFFRPGYAANLVDAWIPALEGGRGQAGRRGAGRRRRLRPRRLHHPARPGLPALELRRVRLPRPLDRVGPQGGRRRRCERPLHLRGRGGRRLPRRRL